MPYQRFSVMLRAGMRRAAYNLLRRLHVNNIPNVSEQPERERMVNELMAEAGIKPRAQSAEQDLAAIDKLAAFFPTPSPEMIAEIKRTRETT